jgi:ABC-2 type transport system ATP-binding protein
MSEYAVEVDNIVKDYPIGFFGRKKKRVLDGVSLKVPQGMIFGVLGSNGAGKTTLLSLMSNLLTPDSGTIRILGRDAVRNPNFVRMNINLCSGNPNFTWCMTVTENLKYYGMLYGLWGAELHRKVDHAIELLELEQYRRTRYDELSTGTKQRLALAKALMTEPKILFLDEPTIGLDPHMAIKTRRTILDIHAERNITVLLTSHYMKEVEDVCERVIFLRDGKVAVEGTPDELKSQVKFKTEAPTMEDVFLELVQ